MFNKYKMDLQAKTSNNFADASCPNDASLNQAMALFYQKMALARLSATVSL
jgi:hypothetical protein